MNDLISRNALLAEYDRVHIGEPGKARKLMEDAPGVDAVPVVRCKDCLFSEPCDASDSYVECHQFFGMAMENDWYCAGGERKDQ